MCAAKSLSLFTKMGMELSRQGERQAALMLLARALRETLRMNAPMAEANIRNNLSLIFQLEGDYALARRQLDRALRLVDAGKCPSGRFRALLLGNHERVDQAQRRAA